MRWYGLLTLVSDGRVKFLLGFVIVAVILAGILAFIEYRIKKKKVRMVEQKVEETNLEKLKKYMKSDKQPREKLDFVNKTAKEYFKEVYGAPLNSGYSFLIQDFDKHKRKGETEFCRSMFATYYSHKELNDERSRALGEMLTDLVVKRERAIESARVPTFFEKIERFMAVRARALVKKKKVRVQKKQVLRLARGRVAERRKLLRVVRKKEVVVKRQKIVAQNEAKRKKKVAVRRQEKRDISRANEVVRHERRKKRVTGKAERSRNKLVRGRTRALRKQRRKEMGVVNKKKKVQVKVEKKKSRELIRQKIVNKKIARKQKVVREKVVKKRGKIKNNNARKKSRVQARVAKKKAKVLGRVVRKHAKVKVRVAKKNVEVAKKKKRAVAKVEKKKARIQKKVSKKRIAEAKVAKDFGMLKKKLVEQNGRVKEYPFDSERKMMSIIRESGKIKTSYVKGAPLFVLDKCTKELIDGKIKLMDAKRKKELLRKLKRGQRQ